MGAMRIALLGAAAAVVTAAAAAAQSVKLNVGGGAVAGFAADDGALVSGASVTRNFDTEAVTGTGLPASVYQTFRSAVQSKPYAYAIPVANGEYSVKLHFAEVWGPAKADNVRLFSVAIEGTPVLSTYDLYADAGANVAAVKTYTTTVADGVLDIGFTSNKQNAVVMAIEVDAATAVPTPTPEATPSTVATPEPTPTPTPVPTPEPTLAATPAPGAFVPIRLNVGGGAAAGFAADDGALVSGASVTRNFGTEAVTGTGLPASVYQTFRSAVQSKPYSYAIPVANGVYSVKLHFAEVWGPAKADNVRLFSVAIEGTPVLSTYDLHADVGANVAAVKTYTTTVADGVLDIGFTSNKQNAVVMAIEVDAATAVPTPTPEPTPSTVATPEPTPSAVPTPEPTPSAVATPEPTPTPTPVPTPEPTPSAVPTPEPTPSAVPTPEPTPTPTPVPTATPAATPATTPAPGAFVPIRVNVGGPAIGNFAADGGPASGATGQRTITAVVSGSTLPAGIFGSFRWAFNGGAFAYAFPVPAGSYTVKLHFAEVWDGAKGVGQRVFSVAVEGTPALTNYDIFAAVGADAAATETATVDVTDGVLDIAFTSVVQNVVVMAIEVEAAGSVPPTPTPSPTPDVSPSPTPDVTPSPTPDVTPSPTPDVTPSPTPDVTPSPTPVPSGELSVPAYINVGGPALGIYIPDTPYVVGPATSTGTIVKPVAGTDNDALYHTFRYGQTVTYELPVAPGTYILRLLFAEVYAPTAVAGARVFSIAVGDAAAAPVAIPAYDLFVDAGEATAVAKEFPVTVTTAPLVVQLVASVQNVALQGMEVVASSTEPPAGLPILLNAGGPNLGDYAADTAFVASPPGTSTGTIVKPVEGTDNDALYHTFRFGKAVKYVFPLPPGTYELSLLFAEVYTPTAVAGARVFSVAVGDGAGTTTVLSDFDIFASVGDATAVRKEFSVDVVTGPLVVVMTASVQNVAVQGLEVYAPGTRPAPTPVPTPSVTPPPPGPADHFAHAVIGDIPTIIDVDGDGQQAVALTGFGSHTHRFIDGVADSLVRATWFNNDTEAVLGQGLSILTTLPLGSTNVRLEVEDSGGDVSADFTVVTVVGSLAQGAYCYYYGSGVTLPLPGVVNAEPKPVFAAVAEDLAFSFFPAGPHGASNFVQRCVFFYKAPAAGNYTFSATYAGGVALFVDAETVFDVTSGAAMGVVELAEGMHEAQLHYQAGAAPSVAVAVNGTAVPAAALEWDSATVLPVITGVSPSTGGTGGGDQVTITGIGFFLEVDVAFGGTPATAVAKVDSSSLTVTTPPSAAETTVDVTVSAGGSVANEGGVSNTLPFTYAGSCPPIAFTQKALTAAGGGDQFIKAPTSIALGPDGRVYVGLYSSVVQALTFDADYVVSDVCTSESLGGQRSVLSLAFDPLAPGDGLVLYAATSILYYHQNLGLPLEDWDNGEIKVLQPNVNGFCLGVVDTPISGLPVSNHDHSIQGLEWTAAGELLIAVGGFTNQGANVNGIKLGGLDETPLSGAYLIADVRKPGFDGAVTYNATTNERYSVQTGGFDVKIFAVGLRNSYDCALHTNGNLYATDNGPNGGFGDTAVGCDASAPAQGTKDELLLLTPGSYHGHPNRNRARTDPRQCNYFKPSAPASPGYTPTLADLKLSSMNGVVEYLGNHWCGALKHDLLLSKFSGQNSAGQTLRAQLGSGGASVTALTTVAPFSGLLMAPAPSGALVACQPQKNKVIIYEPVVPTPPAGAPPAVAAVAPHRGPAGGGNTVTIGGANFGAAPTATLGGAPCTGVTDVAADGSSFKCTVPAGTPGGLVKAVVTRGGDGVASGVTPGNGDYWYMTV